MSMLTIASEGMVGLVGGVDWFEKVVHIAKLVWCFMRPGMGLVSVALAALHCPAGLWTGVHRTTS